ncbi:YolD-like family protein [Terrilactibacillus laevilacticus]|uniref:YolD-like family protein n=1 Tax=Terrilactibacillus laevilacticus TaxID=1380157 RepID=UPI003CCC7A93
MKPILDDQKLQVIGSILIVTVRYYDDGFIETAEGFVTSFDYVLKRIKLEMDFEILW